jgi:ATP-dependent DNA ligase
MTWSLPEPMLTVPTESPDLPRDCAAEPKWDGYRAQLAVGDGGKAVLRSRHGTDMTDAFPEIQAAALAQIPGRSALDGELVVWEGGRLAFERLQQRLARSGRTAAVGAKRWPAHFVAFDLLRDRGEDLTGRPYQRRRQALEALFTVGGLGGSLALCPSTTDPATAARWLHDFAPVGMEGLCFKRLDEPYLPGERAWRKYKFRVTTEAVVGAVTGTLAAPGTLLLGRYDRAGRLQYAGRTTVLTRATAREVGGHLVEPQQAHPWQGWTFSAGWHTRDRIDPVLVEPEVVMEIAVDVARDIAGRWRHPVRAHRARDDMAADQVPPFG